MPTILAPHPSLGPEALAAPAVGSAALLRIGDLVLYRGSLTRHYGPALYAGLCLCGRKCPDEPGQTRVRILTARLETVRHVRCRSFDPLAQQDAVISAELRAAADRLRAQRVIYEAEASEAARLAASLTDMVDPHVCAWHPIAAPRGEGGCSRRARPRCRRCVSAETVRALLPKG